MPGKDYYVVLGVPRSASPRTIRSAYRGLVKSHHPDVVGPGGAGRFREIAEAYETLSDPRRRRRYNEAMARSGVTAEPLARAPIAVGRRPETVRPSFDELYEHLLRNLLGLPKAPRAEALNLDVVLSPREAREGGGLPLSLPVFEVCPACGGRGTAWPRPCSHCDGRGWISVRRHVEVRIPPIAAAGMLDVPLTDLGIDNLFLRLHLHIEA
jgi:molecular chaperone DnaJ